MHNSFSFHNLKEKTPLHTGQTDYCMGANNYTGSFAPSRWFPPAVKQRIGHLAHAPHRLSPMQSASDNQTPAACTIHQMRQSFQDPAYGFRRFVDTHITNRENNRYLLLGSGGWHRTVSNLALCSLCTPWLKNSTTEITEATEKNKYFVQPLVDSIERFKM